MPSHAAAFGWQFVRQHRWTWAALGAWIGVLLALRLLEVRAGEPMFREFGTAYAFAIMVPGGAAFYWLIALFTFGHAGDLAGRPSIFPRRLFTLPLTNAALAAWPMLYGTAAVGLLWVLGRTVAPLPADLAGTMPYVSLGMVMLVLLAWLQAILWSSYPLPGLRVVVVVLVLTAIQLAEVMALEYQVREALMSAFLAPHLPLAYLVAWRAVARARRGDVADWSGVGAALGRPLRSRRTVRPPFSSASAAQRWLEGKRHGRSLPAMVTLVLPVELLLLWVARGAPWLVAGILVAVALTPPFLASFTAMAVRKSGGSDDLGLSPFTATRPLSSASLVGVRLRVAARSTAAAWVLVLAAAPSALVLSGTWGMVADGAGRFVAVVGTPRAVVAGLLALAMLVLTTWRQMVQSLCLTGRPALIRGSALAMLGLLVVIGPLLEWTWERGLRAWFWVGFFGTLAVIVAARMVLASWIVTRLHRERLLPDRSLVAGAALWLGAVLAAYGVLLWLFSTPYMPRFLLLMIAVVMVPLVRLSAAPLALAWNRHR